MEILTSNKSVGKTFFANLPHGARLLDVSEGFVSIYGPDDTFVEQIKIEFRGKEFYILRHEHDNNWIAIFAGCDGPAKMTNVHGIDEFIEQSTGGA